MVKAENYHWLPEGATLGLFGRLVRHPADDGAAPTQWRRFGQVHRAGGTVTPVLDEVPAALRTDLLAGMAQAPLGWQRVELGVPAQGGSLAVLAIVALPPPNTSKRYIADAGVGVLPTPKKRPNLVKTA
jgi:hypothetical protein